MPPVQPWLYPFSLVPEAGCNGPRLWVQRMLVFGHLDPLQVIRDFTLRTGLNIVHSPGAGPGDEVTSHLSGKTTFCRLLRYCLGEADFAPPDDEARIRKVFLAGGVAAQVIVDGEPWSVIRYFRGGDRDIATPDLTLDELLRAPIAPTGIDPLCKAITEGILGDALDAMPATISPKKAWLAALAWLTRDNECRFSQHLVWRDPHSKSHSPVQGISQLDLALIVRALIGAMPTTQADLERTRKEQTKQKDQDQKMIQAWDFEIKNESDELAKVLNEAPAATRADGQRLVDAAKKLKAKRRKPLNSTPTTLADARSQLDGAQAGLHQLEKNLNEILIRAEEKTQSLTRLHAALRAFEAQPIIDMDAICAATGMTLEKAMTEGCLLADVASDAKALKLRMQELQLTITQEQEAIKSLQEKQPELEARIISEKKHLESLSREVARLDGEQTGHSKSLAHAQSLVDRAETLLDLINRRASLIETRQATMDSRSELNRKLKVYHTARGSPVARLSQMFGATGHELLGYGIDVAIKLDLLQLGSHPSSTAISTIKILAFDLAALALSVEGGTYLPGFLLHDSPHEAGTDRSTYDRLFNFVRTLESFGPSPLFQYIITTTTDPPAAFCREPWLRLTMYGSPTEDRFLKVGF